MWTLLKDSPLLGREGAFYGASVLATAVLGVALQARMPRRGGTTGFVLVLAVTEVVAAWIWPPGWDVASILSLLVYAALPCLCAWGVLMALEKRDFWFRVSGAVLAGTAMELTREALAVVWSA